MEDEAVAPIKEFIQNGISITWPLKALGELLPDEECLEFVCRVLSDMGPSYIRMPEKKITLINFLADYQHPLVADTLLSFLEDFDPEVVILTVQVLSKMKEERARAPFLELLCDEEEENPRLKKMIAQEFKQLNWKVREYRERVKENLPPGFNVDRVGYIRGQARQEIADPEYDEE